jgi:broad specificity phosphatase PhoE
MVRLYWIRHGENLANLTKEFSSRLVDYSLTSKGVLQSQQTADFLADRPVESVYTSPLKRAVETAQIIAAPHHLPVIQLENFREIVVGDLENGPPSPQAWQFHNEILIDWLRGDLNRSFPGGESGAQLLERMRLGLKQILADGEDGEDREVIVVSHGGILFVTLRDICPGFDPARHGDIANCSITEIQLSRLDGHIQGQLVSWADHAHLHGEAADLVSGAPG